VMTLVVPLVLAVVLVPSRLSAKSGSTIGVPA
jgi:hypothetical protein